MEISRPISAVRARVATAAYQRPRKLPWGTILLHSIIIFFCLIIILPIAWVILRSITPIPDAYTGQLWPSQFDFTHYTYVFEHIPGFLKNFTNSVIVTTSTVILTSVFAVLAG